MMLYSKHFQNSIDLTAFVNDNALTMEAVLKIDADASNGGWVIWWYADAPPIKDN